MTTAVDTTAPAAVEETPEVTMQERLNAATPEEYTTWEKTGEIPPIKPKSVEPPPKTETPAISTETKETSAVEDKTKTETAAATEAAKPQKKRDADGRVAQLLKERKESDERWEARFKEIEGRLKPAEPSVKPESSSAAEVKTEIKATDAEPELGGVNPKTGKPYQTVIEWQKDHTAWVKATILAEVNGTLSKSDQQRQQGEDQQRRNADIAQKLLPGKDKYPDFEKVAFNPDLTIPLGSPADEFLRNSKAPHDLLYYLGQHPEITNGFYRYVPGKDDISPRNGQPGKLTGHWDQLVPPYQQFAELARIEASLSTAPAPVKPPATTKILPPPPTVLSANGTPSGDPVDEAVKKKDFAAFEAAENQRERKARRA